MCYNGLGRYILSYTSTKEIRNKSTNYWQTKLGNAYCLKQFCAY